MMIIMIIISSSSSSSIITTATKLPCAQFRAMHAPPPPPELEEFFLMGNRMGVGERGEIGNSLENLHAMVEGVSHDDAPVAVDGDAAKRAAELSVS